MVEECNVQATRREGEATSFYRDSGRISTLIVSTKVCTRGSTFRQLQGSKIAYFTNKYLSIWGHMKAIAMPFHMVYGNMIYSKR